MSSVILFISGGEIFVILIVILIFFGADKIPDFARMMGKGVREFRKASDDIKREFNENAAGITDNIRTLQDDISSTFDKEISAPVQDTVNETASTLEEYKDSYEDYYYHNRDTDADDGNGYDNEYHREETQAASRETAEDTPDGAVSGTGNGGDDNAVPSNPATEEEKQKSDS
jgi:TatA/E family protein of Tat protein translocase